MLRQAGVPVIFDEEIRAYRMDRSLYLPPTNFTADEALAMIVLCEALGSGTQIPFYGSARSAAMKLLSLLPERLQLIVAERKRVIHIADTPGNPLHGLEETYTALEQATTGHKAVRIEYESLAEESTFSTKLFPYRMLYSRRSWYVIGRSSLHREVRTFHVGRIRQLVPLDESFEVPRRFSLRRYLRNAWHMIPEPGLDREVCVRFHPLVAQNVAEVFWHKTQRTRFLSDGSLEYRVTVSGLREISWWILGYGDKAEVIEPSELREMIAQHVANMVHKYQLGTSGTAEIPGTSETSGVPAPLSPAMKKHSRTRKQSRRKD